MYKLIQISLLISVQVRPIQKVRGVKQKRGLEFFLMTLVYYNYLCITHIHVCRTCTPNFE